MIVEQWMRRDVVTVSPADDLLKADRLMTAFQIRHLPVLEANGNLAGILSDRDLRDHALPTGIESLFPASQQYLTSLTVAKVMTPKVITIEPLAPMEQAVRLMKTRRINSLPVVSQGKLVGLLTSTTLLTFFDHYMAMGSGSIRLELSGGTEVGEQVMLALRTAKIPLHLFRCRAAVSGEEARVEIILSKDHHTQAMAALTQAGFPQVSAFTFLPE
ncbi:MAG: CBS domain-containing protein [Deltaproteobacteria bacterium]|nr:CBS domain-containing protein [Deltaproteobacteria bacterium]